MDRGRNAFPVFLQHKALSDRRRDDAIPEPLGELSQRPPAGAVRRGYQLEVEGLERIDEIPTHAGLGHVASANPAVTSTASGVAASSHHPT